MTTFKIGEKVRLNNTGQLNIWGKIKLKGDENIVKILEVYSDDYYLIHCYKFNGNSYDVPFNCVERLKPKGHLLTNIFKDLPVIKVKKSSKKKKVVKKTTKKK